MWFVVKVNDEGLGHLGPLLSCTVGSLRSTRQADPYNSPVPPPQHLCRLGRQAGNANISKVYGLPPAVSVFSWLRTQM